MVVFRSYYHSITMFDKYVSNEILKAFERRFTGIFRYFLTERLFIDLKNKIKVYRYVREIHSLQLIK